MTAWRGPARRRPRPPSRGGARWATIGSLAVVALVAWWLRADPDDARGAATVTALPAALPSESTTLSAAPASSATGASTVPLRPLSPLGEAQRREQLALWQARLARARSALEAYQTAARYPHESRPIEEHPDQVHPFEPVAEDRPLRMPGGSVTQGVHLRTTQERLFASGAEASRITLTLHDDAGRPLPLRIVRAVMKEVTPPGRTATTAEYRMPVNDSGEQGDAVAGDGIFTAVMQPATQGFGAFAGTVRLEMHLDYAGQPGFIYFDLTYSPELAATWIPGIREALVNGSLELYAKAQVRMPGRYVVSGRVDDARGKPFALVQFNGELGAGPVEFRLPVFGRLVHDARPAFPLTLRDVEAFLLKPDTFPDRVMLPRLAGAVHTTRSYALTAFSPAEWSSEERDRYLAELGKDVSEAEAQVTRLGP